MTYANTIEALQYMRRNSCEEFVDDLTVAIDLMRMAEPKDAEAEREYCFALERDANTLEAPALWEMFESERAACRAKGSCEGYACGRREQTKMDAAELTAAQAEIERLRALLNDADDAYLADCKTKLANLRAAVEYVENLLGDGRDAMPPTAAKRMLRVAIEASR